MIVEPKIIAVDARGAAWLFPDGHVGIVGELAGNIVKTYPSLSDYWQSRGDEQHRKLKEWRSANGTPRA